MDVAGQGRLLGIRIAKKPQNPEINKPNDNSAFITFKPVFYWTKKRSLPIKIPDSGQHGGVIQSDRTNEKIMNSNSRESISHHTIHIGGLGHGAGAIIVPGAGPVLIGTASIDSNIGPVHFIIVLILLIISSIIWAVIHMICSPRQEDRCQSFFDRRKRKQLNGNLGEQNRSSIYQFATQTKESELQNDKADSSFNGKSQSQTLQSTKSIAQAYTQLIHFNTNAGLRSQSSNSIWSNETQSHQHSYSSSGHLFGGLSGNRIIESEKLGFIFTISIENSPNTYHSKTSTRTHYYQPSLLEECLEIFLLFKENMLIGKMRNGKYRRSSDQFAIQIWNTADGILTKSLPNGQPGFFMTCEALCPVHDEFLVLIRQGEILVWNVVSNLIISESILNSNSHPGREHWDIQPTKSEMEVVILHYHPSSSTTNIYSINFDQLLHGSPQVVHKSFTSTKYFFSLVPSTSLLIASISGEIMNWDFSEDTMRLINKDPKEQIHKILASPGGDLTAFQLDHRISIWKTHQWTQISEIPLSYSEVCAVTFSQNEGSSNLLAVALDGGSIKLFNSSNGDLQQKFNSRLPIVEMTFSSDNHSLIVIADRASRHQLFMFDIHIG